MAKKNIPSKILFQEYTLPANYNPPIVVCCNIKTPENLGNIIRLCDNIVCKEVFFVTNEEYTRSSKIRRTASSSYKAVKWSFCTLGELKQKLPADYTRVAIETANGSKNVFKSIMPEKIAFFVGNEISGIDDEILEYCQEIVHIPMYGNNSSLNVSHALAVVLFEWQKRIAGL